MSRTLTYTDEDNCHYAVTFHEDLSGNVEFEEHEGSVLRDFYVPGELVAMLVKHFKEKP